MDLGSAMCVMDRNACRNCRRPIELLRNIGWVHGELPQYAHEAPTCDRAVPVDSRCPECDGLTPGAGAFDGYVQLARHFPQGMQVLCPGSGRIVARTQ